MVSPRNRLQVEPRLGQIEAALKRAIMRCRRYRLVDVDKRDDDGEVDDGCPEGDLARPEGERVLALHGGGMGQSKANGQKARRNPM